MLDSTFPLDAVDLQLLAALQKDGKRSVKELASLVGLTKTPVYERIRRLEAEGVIRKYVALVDKRALPSRMSAFCAVTLRQQATPHVEAFADAIRDLPEVLDCWVIGGEFDLLLRIVCADLSAYYSFVTGSIAALDNVAHTRSSFIIEQVKASTAWPVR